MAVYDKYQHKNSHMRRILKILIQNNKTVCNRIKQKLNSSNKNVSFITLNLF